jgi:hypothetical protein
VGVYGKQDQGGAARTGLTESQVREVQGEYKDYEEEMNMIHSSKSGAVITLTREEIMEQVLYLLLATSRLYR